MQQKITDYQSKSDLKIRFAAGQSILGQRHLFNLTQPDPSQPNPIKMIGNGSFLVFTFGQMQLRTLKAKLPHLGVGLRANPKVILRCPAVSCGVLRYPKVSQKYPAGMLAVSWRPNTCQNKGCSVSWKYPALSSKYLVSILWYPGSTLPWVELFTFAKPFLTGDDPVIHLRWLFCSM